MNEGITDQDIVYRTYNTTVLHSSNRGVVAWHEFSPSTLFQADSKWRNLFPSLVQEKLKVFRSRATCYIVFNSFIIRQESSCEEFKVSERNNEVTLWYASPVMTRWNISKKEQTQAVVLATFVVWTTRRHIMRRPSYKCQELSCLPKELCGRNVLWQVLAWHRMTWCCCVQNLRFFSFAGSDS